MTVCLNSRILLILCLTEGSRLVGVAKRGLGVAVLPSGESYCLGMPWYALVL